jgi:hypothetical protein
MDKTPKERIRDAARELMEIKRPASQEHHSPEFEFFAATADEMDRQIAFDKARAAAKPVT